MQDEPVMRVTAERLRHTLFKPGLDRRHGLAARQAGAIGNAKDMRVDGEGFLAERAVHDNVRGLATDPRQGFERGTIGGHLAPMIADQRLGQGDNVLRLGIVQADCPDVRLQPLFARGSTLSTFGRARTWCCPSCSCCPAAARMLISHHASG